MAKTYHLGPTRRLVNTVMTPLARLGVAGRHAYILTVRGRRSGARYDVRNARAAGEVQLTRAGHCERLAIEEVAAALAAPVLRQYLKRVPLVRPFFDVSPGSPLSEFETAAPHHPAFRLTDTSHAASERSAMTAPPRPAGEPPQASTSWRCP